MHINVCTIQNDSIIQAVLWAGRNGWKPVIFNRWVFFSSFFLLYFASALSPNIPAYLHWHEFVSVCVVGKIVRAVTICFRFTVNLGHPKVINDPVALPFILFAWLPSVRVNVVMGLIRNSMLHCESCVTSCRYIYENQIFHRSHSRFIFSWSMMLQLLGHRH